MAYPVLEYLFAKIARSITPSVTHSAGRRPHRGMAADRGLPHADAQVAVLPNLSEGSLEDGPDTPIYGFVLWNGNMADKACVAEETQAKLASLADALGLLQAEIGLPQLLALLTIAGEPGLSVNELADRLELPQQTASRHVAVLAGRYHGMFGPAAAENPGRSKLDPLITQEISQSDPRRRALFISKQGRALREAMAERLAPVADVSRHEIGGTA
jgi:DNA-binding MarR family transcriptional regulator